MSFNPIVLNPPFQTAPGWKGGTSDLAEWDALLSNPSYFTPLREMKPILQIPTSILNSEKQELHSWASEIISLGLQFSLNDSPISKVSTDGKIGFDRLQKNLNNWFAVKGTCAEIAIDDPFAMALNIPELSYQQLITDLVTYLNLVRKTYPDIFVFCNGTFPGNKVNANSGYNIANIEALNTALIASGGKKIDGWRMDIGTIRNINWDDLSLIQTYCDSNKIAFSMICDGVGASRESGNTGESGDVLWLENILSQSNSYKATGKKPDQLCFQSWIGLPSTFEAFVSGILQVIDLWK